MSQHQRSDNQEMQRTAGVLGGKTARACDSCVRRRARWYCAADDAFLCQVCDSSVHSANPLARRHERVRLKSSAPSVLKLDDGPAWHQAITRKARTPRPKPGVLIAAKSEPLVPDLEASSADENNAADEEQLLYRVPVLDPVLAEFCSPPPGVDGNHGYAWGSKPALEPPESGTLAGFLQPDDDVDLAEFAADMETLLGRGLDDDAFCMEGLGLDFSGDGNKPIKIEMKEELKDVSQHQTDVDLEMEMDRDTVLDFNFDCGSPPELEEKVSKETSGVRRMKLRLDYDAVIAAWSSSCQGLCPWTDGERPKLNPNDCRPDYKGGMWPLIGGPVTGQVAGGGDGGREARVTRYREKRRTRLFAKKIRYEVRKLNAEKRPRMKGRFVKRASFPAGVSGGASFSF
ncbi:hypothetical protein J5N97_016880 [Dioscorea zingiberensis]|uniref:Zinc finger protein CONSTANS-LIKE 16 n=1 Tax=Dioscorea zingiberensis TaxID=325984 RepID=A0A9D5CKQ1_9LILI|nr:hypothetical protein J5N97_016880 [Dioscorea zingiberensis]